MARRPHIDHRQGDLLAWEPPVVVERYDERRVRAVTLPDRIAMAVSATLTDCELSREEIAAQMTAMLGADVSKAMLDNYASPSKEHTISLGRALALMAVTEDTRLLQLVADQLGLVVIEERYEDAVLAEIIREQREELEARERDHRRAWKSRSGRR